MRFIILLSAFFLSLHSYAAEPCPNAYDTPLETNTADTLGCYIQKNKMWVSLNPEVQLAGLFKGEDGEPHLFHYKDDRESVLHIKNIFGYLLRTAYNKAVQEGELINSDSNLKDPSSFSPYLHAFLYLTLTVPHHESRYLLFRTAKGKQCHKGLNSGGIIKDLIDDNEVWTTFRDNFFQYLNPVIPSCDFYGEEEYMKQILFSSTGDVGTMQINLKAHPAVIEPAYLLNMYRGIEYGVNYLYEGFSKISNQYQTFNCKNYFKKTYSKIDKDNYMKGDLDKDGRFTLEELNQIIEDGYESVDVLFNQKWSVNSKLNANIEGLDRLVHATYGVFNGGYGNDSSTKANLCRFMNANHGYQKHSKEFNERTIHPFGAESSMLHKILSKSSVERKALDEILNNFTASQGVQGKEFVPYTNLKKVLDKYPENLEEYIPLDRKFEPNYYVEGDAINFRRQPKVDLKYKCGTLVRHEGYEWPIKLKVNEVLTTKSANGDYEDKWARVELPRVANTVHWLEQNENKCRQLNDFYIAIEYNKEDYLKKLGKFEKVAKGIVESNKVNLRSSPMVPSNPENDNKIDQIINDNKVTEVNILNSMHKLPSDPYPVWYEIEWNGGTAWIWAGSVKLIEEQ